MDLIILCVLFIYLCLSNLQRQSSETTLKRDPIFYNDNGHCWVYGSTFGSDETLKLPENCTHLNLNSVNITKPTLELFDDVTKGIHSLSVVSCSVDAVYLPVNLTSLEIINCTTQLVIDENSTYNLEELKLDTMPQLPVSLHRLHLLRNFECNFIPEEHLNFSIFSEMTQIDKIIIFGLAAIKIPDSVRLPSLRELTIDDTPIGSFATAASNFPNLQILHLRNNSLAAAAIHFSAFTNLTHLSVSKNKLRRVSLDTFANMTQLQNLIWTDDHIFAITTQNSLKLPHLRCISLDNNFLTELDATMWTVPSLQYLSLTNNHLTHMPGLMGLVAPTQGSQTFMMFANRWDPRWLNETERQINGTQLFVSRNASYYPSTGSEIIGS